MQTNSNTNSTVLDLLADEMQMQFPVLGMIAEELEGDLLATMPVGTYSLCDDIEIETL